MAKVRVTDLFFILAGVGALTMVVERVRMAAPDWGDVRTVYALFQDFGAHDPDRLCGTLLET